MGLYEQFPYTNFHELNLDWFLNTFKDLLDEWERQKTEFANMEEAFGAMKKWVNNYFDDLDVQEEINNKLDDMMADGSLAIVLGGLISDFESDYNARLSALSARVDAFERLDPGSTTGDAELIDARIAGNGATYPTAGDSIRAQYDMLNSKFSQAMKGIDDLTVNRFKKYSIRTSTGEVLPGDSTQLNTDPFYVGTGNKVYLTVKTGYLAFVTYYSGAERSTYTGRITGSISPVTNRQITADSDYIGITVVKSDYTEIQLSEADAVQLKVFNYVINRIGFIMSGIVGSAHISVNTDTHIITFPDAYCVMIYGNKRISLRNRTLDYSDLVTSEYGHIFYNLSTDAFFLGDASSSDRVSYSDDLVWIGSVWNAGAYINLTVLPYYVVNGVKRTFCDPALASRPHLFRMAVLGDSISTYVGVSEDTQSGELYYTEYYPTGGVSSISATWWDKVRRGLGCVSVAVSAISRSGYHRFPGDTKNPPGGTSSRISRLANNGTPDVIFVELGLNDAFATSPGTNLMTNDIATLSNNNSETYSGCGETIRKLQDAYPNAKIIVLLPKNLVTGLSDTYPTARQVAFWDAIETVCKQMGVFKVIDLRKCGINVSNAPSFTIGGVANGIHPNAAGMQLIADYILSELAGVDWTRDTGDTPV